MQTAHLRAFVCRLFFCAVGAEKKRSEEGFGKNVYKKYKNAENRAKTCGFCSVFLFFAIFDSVKKQTNIYVDRKKSGMFETCRMCRKKQKPDAANCNK